jgi:hypothetical protein
MFVIADTYAAEVEALRESRPKRREGKASIQDHYWPDDNEHKRDNLVATTECKNN